MRYVATVASTPGEPSIRHDLSWYGSMCEMELALLGYATPPKVRQWSRGVSTVPGTYGWAIPLADSIACFTSLDDDECLDMMAHLYAKYQEGKLTFDNSTSLVRYAIAYASDMPYEPMWHVRRRHDTSRMSEESWHLLSDIRNGRIGCAKIRQLTKHQPRYFHLDAKGHAGMMECLTNECNRAIARLSEAECQYDALGIPIVMHDKHHAKENVTVGMDGLPVFDCGNHVSV